MIGMWIAVTVVFWNLENFFDYKADGVSASEMEFSASGERRWSKKRFYDKCNGVAKTLLLCGEAGGEGGGVGAGGGAGGGSECPVAGGQVTGGGPPDIAGFAEVENAFVVRQLVNSTLLAKLDYGIVHYDSPDRRGIDCALIYRKSRVSLVDSTPCHLLDSSGSVVPTRDLLLARFDCGGDTIAVIVNHHPSKLGGGKDGRRKLAMKRMNAICDSLESRGTHRILCIGDFNDDVWSEGKVGAEGYTIGSEVGESGSANGPDRNEKSRLAERGGGAGSVGGGASSVAVDGSDKGGWNGGRRGCPGDRPGGNTIGSEVGESGKGVFRNEAGRPGGRRGSSGEADRPGGTIKFNGVWEKIDGHFARGLEVRETVLHAPHLLTRDKAFGGLKPLRTYSGPRYLGGLSDHLPVIFEIKVPD